MPGAQLDGQPVLYVIACGAPPAGDVEVVVRLAQASEWTVCVIGTPAARAWLDVGALEALTGYPVRVEHRRPGELDVLPPPSAIVVAPATFNTVNKWAAGISDTLALGLLNEALGKGLPVVAMPFLNTDLAVHPVFEQSIERLRSWGVRVLYGPEIFELPAPGMGGSRLADFPWPVALDAATAALAASRTA
jgi:hypothetical protein